MSTQASTQRVSEKAVLSLQAVEHCELIESIKTLDSSHQKLIRFLEEDLLISPSSIALALRHAQQDRGPLSMVLWRYGFVSLEQLNQIFDWTANNW